jgi:hypothetical protein
MFDMDEIDYLFILFTNHSNYFILQFTKWSSFWHWHIVVDLESQFESDF